MLVVNALPYLPLAQNWMNEWHSLCPGKSGIAVLAQFEAEKRPGSRRIEGRPTK